MEKELRILNYGEGKDSLTDLKRIEEDAEPQSSYVEHPAYFVAIQFQGCGFHASKLAEPRPRYTRACFAIDE
jgi:hypothetical protein